jgi:hypothetical protein
MSNFINHHGSEDPNHSSPLSIRKSTKTNRKTQEEHDTSISDGISEELHPSPEKNKLVLNKYHFKLEILLIH